jgi:hypothetical protein
MNDHIISLRGEDCDHKNSLCAKPGMGYWLCLFSTILIFDFGNVQTSVVFFVFHFKAYLRITTQMTNSNSSVWF